MLTPPDPPDTTNRCECARSSTGLHELAQFASIGARDDRRYPPGTEIYVRCLHCGAGGRAVLEDGQVHWDDAEKLPE